MKRILFAAILLIASFLTHAGELVARDGQGNHIRITDGPCAVKRVLDALYPGMQSRLGAASALIDGKPYQACWVDGGDTIHLLFDDGDYLQVPSKAFRDAKAGTV